MIAQNQNIDFDALWRKSIVRVTDEFKLPPVILQVDDAIIGTLGNFSVSTGKAKAKKTFNVSAIVAAALINGQVLEYRASLPEGKRKILYFDTEQSPFHCKLVLQRILKLAGLPLNQQLENLIFSHLREISDPAIRCEVIRKAIYEIDGVGLVVIDGIRDLILDINNPTQSTILIGNLMQWTSERGIHIQTVLHLNKGDNSRGHIGTELNNKAETVLQVTKDPTDPERSIVSPTFIRSKPFEKFAFRITDEADHINVPELDINFYDEAITSKTAFDYTELSEEQHRQALEIVFSDCEDGLGYSELVDALRNGYAEIVGITYGIGNTKKLLTFLKNKRMITKKDKKYVYAQDFYY